MSYLMPFAKQVATRAITHGVRPTARDHGIPRTTLHAWRARYVHYDRRTVAWTTVQHVLRHLQHARDVTLAQLCAGISLQQSRGCGDGNLRGVLPRGLVVRSGVRKQYRYTLVNYGAAESMSRDHSAS